jgi:hypothetical protein
MAGLRFTALQSRPLEFLDFTSVTLDEFQQLVPPFETAFQCHMAAGRMDGKPRTARRFTVYKTCPLPTPEDRLLFILMLLAALRALGDAPARSLTALAQRLGISEADAATVVTPLEEAPAPVVGAPAAAPVAPLLPMTAPSGASSAPKTLLHRRIVIAGRKRITPSKMSCSSMPCSSMPCSSSSF